MLFFRIRFLIRATKHVSRMPAVHAPLVYALLCEAWGKGTGRQTYLPDNIMVIAPEQLRIRLKIGETYAFGASLTATSVQDAHELVRSLCVGLQRHGTETSTGPDTLAGNFELVTCEDLFAGCVLTEDQPPFPLAPQQVLEQCRVLMDRPPIVTLCFQTPLRWQIPGASAETGFRKKLYFDRRNFDAGLFLQKVAQRLDDLGLNTSGGAVQPDYSQAKVLENRLVWIDCDYRSGRQKRTQLSGSKGRITLQLPADYPVHCLVWAQYLQLGWSTKFGHGAFRIEELGPDPCACHRSKSLLQMALESDSLAGFAVSSGTSPAAVEDAVKKICAHSYVPLPYIPVPLEKLGKQVRQLSIPQPVDRALQRSVLETLAPGLDDLFEKSSFAYRRGLGRHHAAAEIQRAWKQGFRWAVQADFERFFDSVDHSELSARLHAYLSDDSLARLVLQWMEVSSGEDRCGLPTGAPLSPLMANLFLDRFDEQIRNGGGRLVRYADDFLILVRTKEAAEEMFAMAGQLANELRLRLNATKQQLLDLSQPFSFLGFRFQKQNEWQIQPGLSPIEVQRLGWYDASRDLPVYAPKFLLPGESRTPTALTGTTCIIEEATWLGVEDGRLVTIDAAGTHQTGPAVDSVHQLLILGDMTIDSSLWKSIRDHNTALLMADDTGRILMEWIPDDASSSAELLTAQADACRNPDFRLNIARQIVAAKLINYAGLASVVPVQSGADDTPYRLQQMAKSASAATSLEQLLGFEGAGAAAWYGSLSRRLPSRFLFPGRVAPKAHDPVNVLLNIAQTHIYRQCRLALRLHGLEPSLGIMHTASPGHAALASDLQEVFRMLADRAALETAWKAQHNDFRSDEYGYYPLVATATVRRRLLGTLHQSLGQSARSEGQEEPYSFRSHMLRLARSLKTALLNPDRELRIFQCPLPPVTSSSNVRKD